MGIEERKMKKVSFDLETQSLRLPSHLKGIDESMTEEDTSRLYIRTVNRSPKAGVPVSGSRVADPYFCAPPIRPLQLSSARTENVK